jgi:uncharacterized membrane protein required for colicin V production
LKRIIVFVDVHSRRTHFIESHKLTITQISLTAQGALPMQTGLFIDGLIVGFLLLQTYLGWRRGLLWQAAGVASIAFGVILGLYFAPRLGEFFNERVTSNVFRARMVAFLLILCSVGFTLRIMAAWAEVHSENGLPKKEREIRRAGDRILGGMFGAVKGCVLVLVIVSACVSMYPASRFWPASMLALPLANAGSRLLPEGAVSQVQRWAADSALNVQQGLDIR